ncbi:MAG TPA: xanthine dehydrogenase family protein molybdopterin-binding subunit [Azospirillaceae bacterium]|nr:xanthine dehydrogenase family protein molybdopterin-binding subunit [Azospirillaceae bacterium]
MTKFGVGQPVPRTEDARLLRGRGRYTDDLSPPGCLHMALLRSPHAHAELASLDVSAARGAPGMLAVYTAAELEAAGIGDIPCLVTMRSRDGSMQRSRNRPVLARGRVRHVGEPVAAVVAESPEAARDAAELIEADYRPLDAVADLAAARDGRVLVWPDVPGNLCFDWEKGDRAAVDAAFAAAARTVSLDLVNNRVVPTPMEGRAALAEPVDGRLRLHVGSQGVHFMRDVLSKLLKLPKDGLQVVTGDVGGGFGMKMFVYPEYALVLHAARELGRPVKWASDRGEAFLSDDHGRDNLSRAALALDADGRFLAIRVETAANLGAYLSNYAPYIPTEGAANMLSGVYRIPAVYANVKGVFTNTAPVDAYRGAGRPEAAYLVERLVDHAARELGIDPAELRRRNFVPPDAMPYKTPMAHTYDSGHFARTLELALERADRAGFPARREASKARGRLRGLGFATYIEACSGGGPEQATVEVGADGRVTVLIGSQSNGQGHETAYKQLVAEQLGLPPDRIEVVQGDSDRISFGSGTGGSRSIPVGGAALAEGTRRVADAMRRRAADLLEAAEVDLELVPAGDGPEFRVVGTDRAVSFEAVAKAAAPGDGGPAFTEVARWTPPAATFPNGTHVCELEVDPATGAVTIERYTVVDDFGTVLNPLLLKGQVQGGITQGIGQALHEGCVYDPDSGQLLTGSLMDYGLPRADDVPLFDIHLEGTPCRTNALGMKGAGEAGSIGAPPAVINALVDALAERGVRHVDMPAMPEKVWRLANGLDAA